MALILKLETPFNLFANFFVTTMSGNHTEILIYVCSNIINLVFLPILRSLKQLYPKWQPVKINRLSNFDTFHI